jgi:hypothetical protein
MLNLGDRRNVVSEVSMSANGPTRQMLHWNLMSASGGVAEVARTFRDRETRERGSRPSIVWGKNDPCRGAQEKSPTTIDRVHKLALLVLASSPTHI